MRSLRFQVIVAALAGLAGCAGSSDKERAQSPIAGTPAAPPSGEMKRKAAPLPELPDGAGPIDPDAPHELSPTRSGLYYRILRKSTGRRPKSFEKVLAHYRGTLDNGQQFDSSYERGEPIEFGLNQVVAGWTEGLQYVGEGGMIELEIPPRLGYGALSQRGIPANSTLHFIVELKKVR